MDTNGDVNMKIVMIGGNGYLGRNVAAKILAHDEDAQLYVLSRSGKNELASDQITNIAIDLADYDAIKTKLPQKVDYVIDFVGQPAKDQETLNAVNMIPAQIMLKLAKDYDVKKMGFIGGVLGPKEFVAIKSQIIKMLKASGIPLAVVEPTLVYGNGRQDSMTKMVPLLRILGVFSAKFRPVHVDDVANELVSKLFNF